MKIHGHPESFQARRERTFIARNARWAAALALTAATALTLTGLSATSASAIDVVPCDSGDYVKLDMHHGDNEEQCFANGGEAAGFGPGMWADKIWTGNNHVQWYGDGRWQPDDPIPPHTTFTWPNHPGGVRIENIRIV